MGGEEDQQIELLRSELDSSTFHAHFSRSWVDPEIIDLDDRTRTKARPVGTFENSPDPRSQLPGREGFDHIIIGTQLQPEHTIGLLTSGGEHDHRNVGSTSKFGEQRVSVDLGEHHVEHDQVGKLFLEGSKSSSTVRSLDDVQPVAAQVGGHHFPDHWLVVNHQDGAAGKLTE